MEIKKIKDLKDYLMEMLEALENLDEEKEIDIRIRAYGLYCKFLSIPSVGYIDLDKLKEDSERQK